MLVGVDASGSAEQVDLGNAVLSGASRLPEETQRHSCPPSSSRVSNHVESQPSTQTTANETNPSLPSGPHLEVDQLIEPGAAQTLGAKNGAKGIKGRNASLLTFNKKMGALEPLKRNRPVRDNQSTSTTLGSMAFHSGPSIETSLHDGDGNAATPEQTNHGDTEPRLLLEDYEEQNQPCPASPNIE
jgi:hypothetical protein